jgi:hypothetical protein
MEVSPARQKLLFVLIVVVLAGLGYYLLLPALHKNKANAPAAESPSSSAPAVSTPTVAPAATVTGSPASGSVNIYDWLPFTEQDLTAAATMATRFCVDYDTYTYTENATTYIGKMDGLITSELAAVLENGYTTPGVASLRTEQKWISSGTAAVDLLRAFGPSSLTFVVNTTQHLITDKATTNNGTQYAITLTGSGDQWQVSDIEPAGAGNV